MRFSCNGCRVLRKGCSEDCSLRPCLEWLSSPESQANATVFLSKFYGRHGLINLINAAPPHLRPEIFRSLLYEACGRIINPVYGSVGLMSSGDWPRCQAAVEAVLGGRAHFVKQVAATCDISKDSATAFHPRNRRKRSASQADSEAPHSQEAKFTITGWDQESKREDDSSSVEPSLVKFDEHPILESPQLSEMGLDLTLGFNPDPHTYLSAMRDF